MSKICQITGKKAMIGNNEMCIRDSCMAFPVSNAFPVPYTVP